MNRSFVAVVDRGSDSRTVLVLLAHIPGPGRLLLYDTHWPQRSNIVEKPNRNKDHISLRSINHMPSVWWTTIM